MLFDAAGLVRGEDGRRPLVAHAQALLRADADAQAAGNAGEGVDAPGTRFSRHLDRGSRAAPGAGPAMDAGGVVDSDASAAAFEGRPDDAGVSPGGGAGQQVAEYDARHR